MATEPDSWNSLVIPRDRPGGRARPKPRKRHDDMYLCVALVVLIAWALLSVIF